MKLRVKKWWAIVGSVIVIVAAAFQCSPPTPPDVLPPVCVVVYPYPGQVVSGQLNVIVSATDDDEVAAIDLYIDDTKVKSQTGNKLEYLWNTSNIADNRDHHVRALAVDKSGNIGYSERVIVRVSKGSTADTLAPVVQMLYPPDGATLRGDTTITVVAKVIDQSDIEKVVFYIDGQAKATVTSAPYQFNWDLRPYADGGVHTIFVEAQDVAGNVGTLYQTVTVTSP